MSKFRVLPEEPSRDMIEGTYMLLSTMPRGTPERDKAIIREIWREAVKLAPPARTGGIATKRMRRCLEIIVEYIDDHNGMSPTYQEIADQMGMNKGDVFKLVKQLVRRGYVETVEQGHRGIRVLRRH
jgi:predicted transcriptional regulator